MGQPTDRRIRVNINVMGPDAATEQRVQDQIYAALLAAGCPVPPRPAPPAVRPGLRVIPGGQQ